MDPLGAVCSMTNPSQSNQISMTNFARSQQKKLRKISGKFKFFRAPLGPWGSLLECMPDGDIIELIEFMNKKYRLLPN